jgi:glycosyltransferase involved in cell wall biosynthesis
MALNVLQISESDTGGGAALAAARIHGGLEALGHRSRMLVGRRLGEDPRVRRLKRSAVWRVADRAAATVLDPLGLQYVFYPSSFGVASDPWFREADVVQLHNTHGSYFSHTALPFLSRRRPVVWFLHDQWPFTGHVAYSFDCDRWRHGCGTCPYLHEYPALPRDTTALLWRIKRGVYRRSRLWLVSPSRWLERLASESPLLGRFPVRRVPNGVDLARFRPGDRRALKRELGLDPERPLLLWVSAAPDDRRKGSHLLEEIRARVGVEHQFLAIAGGLSETEMAQRYAAADVYLLPSLADNLPNTAVESIAAGTPVAAFDVGGVSDVVRHLETGLLASAGDTAGLAAGVRQLLEDDELRARIGARARETAEAEFSIELQVRRLVELYEELVAA